MPRRVLYITGEYPPMHGGVGDYTALLADSMPGHGWEPFVLTSRSASGDDCRVLAWVDQWSTSIFTSVRDALDRTGADIVHIQYQTGAYQLRPSINLLPYQLSRSARPVPVVTTFHDLRAPYLFPRAGRLRRWANRLLALWSDIVVLTNEQDYRQVSRARRLAGRIRHIPIGSNLPEVRDVDRVKVLRDFDIDPDRFVIGFFGFLTPDKGVDDLLDALELMPDTGLQLLIVGGGAGTTDVVNSDYQRRLRQRIDRSLAGVTVTGYIEAQRAAEALAAADLIVLPFQQGASLRSGSLIAALRSRTPVITTDPRAEDSLRPLTPGEAIWFAPPGEPASLAGAIGLLRREPSLRWRLAVAARSAAAAFDWPAIARQHARIYDDLT